MSSRHSYPRIGLKSVLTGGEEMEFLRVIKDGRDLAKVIDMPSTLKNRKAEVIIFPYEEPKAKTEAKSLRGALTKYKNEMLMSEEQSVWAKVAVEKHEDS